MQNYKKKREFISFSTKNILTARNKHLLIMKIAILTSGILPVPAVNGGAVEVILISTSNTIMNIVYVR